MTKILNPGLNAWFTLVTPSTLSFPSIRPAASGPRERRRRSRTDRPRNGWKYNILSSDPVPSSIILLCLCDGREPDHVQDERILYLLSVARDERRWGRMIGILLSHPSPHGHSFVPHSYRERSERGEWGEGGDRLGPFVSGLGPLSTVITSRSPPARYTGGRKRV